jgi:hypothetical protein
VQRPQTLADVAQEVIGSKEDERLARFGVSLGEFLDEFYLDHGSIGQQQARLDPVPECVGDPLIDAWIGAAGEHLARRWSLKVPPWTERDHHFALEQASFHPPHASTRAILIIESPPAFRRRLIFTALEPLLRARFPSNRKATSPLAWPPLTTFEHPQDA